MMTPQNPRPLMARKKTNGLARTSQTSTPERMCEVSSDAAALAGELRRLLKEEPSEPMVVGAIEETTIDGQFDLVRLAGNVLRFLADRTHQKRGE